MFDLRGSIQIRNMKSDEDAMFGVQDLMDGGCHGHRKNRFKEVDT